MLLLGMYLAFLCFQVSYNLAVARNIRLCKHAAAARAKQLSGYNTSIDKKHTTVLAKAKTAPTKRFHPKFASIVPAYTVTVAAVYTCAQKVAVVDPPSIQQIALRNSALRGPPAVG